MAPKKRFVHPALDPKRHEVAASGELVASVIAAHGIGEELRAHRIIAEWPQLVGERIAKRTWPDGLSKRVLWVRVVSSAWLHELTLLKGQIMQGLLVALPPPALFDDLRFHLGNRRASDDDLLANVARPTGRAPVERRVFSPASPQRAMDIDRESAAIEDAELREIVAELRKRVDR